MIFEKWFNKKKHSTFYPNKNERSFEQKTQKKWFLVMVFVQNIEKVRRTSNKKIEWDIKVTQSFEFLYKAIFKIIWFSRLDIYLATIDSSDDFKKKKINNCATRCFFALSPLFAYNVDEVLKMLWCQDFVLDDDIIEGKIYLVFYLNSKFCNCLSVYTQETDLRFLKTK